MYRDSLFIRMCASKRFYRTPERAQKAIKKCKRERPGTKLRWYACKYCQGFHLTSQPMKPPEPEQEKGDDDAVHHG